MSEKETVLLDWIERHSALLIRTAYYYVRDRMVAEDIVQDVFVKAFDRMEEFRGDGRVEAWLSRMTVNACKDYLRSWRHRNIVVQEFVGLKATTSSAETAALAQVQNQELAARVLKLPVKYREAVVLHYFEQLKIREIADLLELTESTVKVRLHRGLKKLQQELGEEERALWNV
ncbi:sigma-70 family RNA polymerase sigma factor [Tumebacillus flagellatus]|uniref:RNA polymerase factor sigma C n=1 Tax=Tumebacillus flagellatus TaxID=1157490 RepID=A0A074LWK5_9BACL|nr:sigma-70 family RNA polymerase sigma factor [Tumebacillus flagellatus]KEO84468.1 RNA polymerase factor sigma C [Tumebacillus flagellatus]